MLKNIYQHSMNLSHQHERKNLGLVIILYIAKYQDCVIWGIPAGIRINSSNSTKYCSSIGEYPSEPRRICLERGSIPCRTEPFDTHFGRVDYARQPKFPHFLVLHTLQDTQICNTSSRCTTTKKHAITATAESRMYTTVYTS